MPDEHNRIAYLLPDIEMQGMNLCLTMCMNHLGVAQQQKKCLFILGGKMVQSNIMCRDVGIRIIYKRNVPQRHKNMHNFRKIGE